MYTEINAGEQQELMQVLDNFPELGKVRQIQRNTKANVNAIYLVDTEQGKYILRKSNPNTTEMQLEFEEAVLRGLEEKQCGFVPRIVETRDQKTLFGKFRLFTFLEGKDAYEWNSRNFLDGEYASRFSFMAKLHSLLADLNVKDLKAPFAILSFLQEFPHELDRQMAIAPEDQFSDILKTDAEFIKQQCGAVKQALLDLSYRDAPKQVIHADIHLGNVLFRDGQVSGLVDFDWVTIESPWWDFAYSFTQNGTRCGEKDGELNPTLFALALQSYCGERELTKEELRLLQLLVKAADIRNLKWVVDTYYEPSLAHLHEKCAHYREHFLNTLKQNEYHLLGVVQ